MKWSGTRSLLLLTPYMLVLAYYQIVLLSADLLYIQQQFHR